MTSIESLEALFVANPDFDEIEKSLDIFCPFEAIGVVRQEIRHGNFLAYCLDPQRPHGFGSECLRALMRSAAYSQRLVAEVTTSSDITPLDVHLMDFEKAQIRREWKKIDILAIIKEEQLVIAIELKIDSSERGDQLRRYRKTVREHWSTESGWKHLFLYLTKHGDEASETDGEDWLPLDLSSVANELDSITHKQLGTPDSRNLLAAYLTMLRRHHLTNERSEELAAKLWNQHREALEFLMEHRPDNGDGMLGNLYLQREDIAKRISQASEFEIITDDSSLNKIRFAVKKWDELPDFLTAQGFTPSNRILLLELERSTDRRNLRVRFALGPAKEETRLKYFDALVAAKAPNSNKKAITSQWTRLGTQSFSIPDEDETNDSSGHFEKVLEFLDTYVKKIIPQYDAAFQTLTR